MSVAKVTEISSTSSKSFEDAIQQGPGQSRKDDSTYPRRLDQRAARALRQWAHHRVPSEHDGDICARRLELEKQSSTCDRWR